MMTVVKYKLGDRDHRPWGQWEVIAVADDHIIKRLVVMPGYRSSLQRHAGRNEHWIILRGELIATVNDQVQTLRETDHIYIPIRSTHRMQNAGNISVTMIEIQTGSLLSEMDIVRLEDDFGRASP